ncbi:MAG: methyltransferase domain-containing protein [Roseobacter sp.]|nr:methyltransferase domain-containing protein [Roseobacter sp.]
MGQADGPETMQHDFSLRSGERQIAPVLKDIRGDHVNRYRFGLQKLHSMGLDAKSCYGLDVFCGNGYGSSMAAEEGYHILGLDASEDALRVANKHYASSTVCFAQKEWPFELPSNVFDFCFCLESIEHIANGSALISALYHALKPGGVLIMSTPNQDQMPFVPKQHKFHLRHYTQKESFELLNQHEMKLISWGGQTVYDISENGAHRLKFPNAEVMENIAGQFTVLVAQK